jgi:hypothetical protein
VPFSVSITEISQKISSISESNILRDNQWSGSDFQNTKIAGMRIFGSFIKSDSDTGSIGIKVKNGSKFFYRSGPITSHQTLEVIAGSNLVFALPPSPEWTLISFNTAKFSQGEFAIKLSDTGIGWGEWSAIAVKSDTEK